MDRLRKFSKVFHKDSPAKQVEPYVGTKPVYRGRTPLTVSDIHSHSPVKSKSLEDSWDELGVILNPRVHPSPVQKEQKLVDILDSFPTPPPFRPVVTNAHPDGPRFYFPMDDLLPPPPDKVLDMIKERERTRTHEARLEQHRALPVKPLVAPVNSYDLPPYRLPLYANSRANMSTRSLGANASLKAGPPVQRTVVQQVNVVHGSAPLKADSVMPVPRRSPPRTDSQQERLYAMPEGERKRLRSVPTQLSPTQLSAGNEELYKAYPSTLQGRPKRHM
ncbi:hypothetical protein FB451DRAFT_223038 [Mycena latifolia]|nr:hypothetical protein FB451DRAFT_223038 [Mycena latifolia]